MVKTLHQAGIEVILDVVYNHTAEGNHMGPTLSFKGIDNAVVLPARRGRQEVLHGLHGHREHAQHAQPVRRCSSSWTACATGRREMHVDGFRFDLASTLARSLHEVDRLSAFFDLVQQDPVVSQLKLIAEPWDVGDGGYQVGNFPPQWAEWNGKYRDCIRDHWAGAPHTLGEFAYRITGSSDLYEAAGRRPHASINFVTAHDGFTMRDLVSYNEKHNEANGEDNNDGESHNRGWNCGAEGPTDDPEINALRARQQRNLIGDAAALPGRADDPRRRRDRPHAERQQQRLLPGQRDLLVRLVDRRRPRCSSSRQQLDRVPPRAPLVPPPPVLPGPPAPRCADRGPRSWFSPTGEEMTEEQWSEAYAHALTLFMSGRDIERDQRGEMVMDDDFLWMVNASPDDIKFTVPRRALGHRVVRRRSTPLRVSSRRPSRRSTRQDPRSTSSVARWSCCVVRAPSRRRHDVTTVHDDEEERRSRRHATYRFQLRAEFGFDDAAAQARLPRAARRLPRLPVAAAPGRGRFHARVRRRRPDSSRATSSAARRRRRVRRRAAQQRSRTGRRHRAQPPHDRRSARTGGGGTSCSPGRASRYARHFDIDWDSPDRELTGKVVVPVLGKSLAEELAAGSIDARRARRRAGRAVLRPPFPARRRNG